MTQQGTTAARSTASPVRRSPRMMAAVRTGIHAGGIHTNRRDTDGRGTNIARHIAHVAGYVARRTSVTKAAMTPSQATSGSATANRRRSIPRVLLKWRFATSTGDTRIGGDRIDDLRFGHIFSAAAELAFDGRFRRHCLLLDQRCGNIAEHFRIHILSGVAIGDVG